MQTLHIISHTHWDREWYLTFQQFRLKLVHLVDKLLDILDADADFKYFMLDGQTIVLDDYLHMRPENEERLRSYIQAGRILIGPWHILPDMFLVSPEAHIRNLLQGARTARKFGPRMPIGYIPDPFGHPGQIPQILNGFGIQAACLWRGLSDQPAELRWRSPDGSNVLLAYLRDSYSNGANLPVHNPELFAGLVASAGKSMSTHSAVNDHLIMLGTDHMEPSPHTSACIAYANACLPGTQLVHSTLPGYIESIKAQIEHLEKPIPTVVGELRACDRSNLLPGVLSTRIWIKQRNHSGQTLLEKWAEPFSVFAETMLPRQGKLTLPAEVASDRIRNVAPILRQAWRILMENHPHDSICGCSIDQVHDEMKPRFDQVDQIGEEITHQALQAISNALDTRADEAFSAIVLFNPHDTPRGDILEVALHIPETVPAFELLGENKTVLPYEFIGASNTELANLLLKKNELRDTIGAINEGRVAGAAIVRVKVTRQDATVTIDAILDDKSQPDLTEWQRAEADIARYEADPSVTRFHVLAHTPQTSKVRFLSPQIPAMGWHVLWVRALPAPAASPTATVSPLLKLALPMVLRLARSPLGEKLLAARRAGDETRPPFVIQNENFIVEASQSDGTLTITDQRTKTIFNALNRFVDGGEAGDEYNYSPPTGNSFQTPRLVSLKVFRHRLVQTLEIAYELKVPAQLAPGRKDRSQQLVSLPIHSRVSLAPGGRRIDIHTEVENNAKDHRLRVHFTAPISVQEADYDGHFEVVRRPLGVPPRGENWVEEPRPEVPQRAFTDVSDGKTGLMIANRGLPEVEVLRNGEYTEIALTLLRCVGWLSRDDMPVRQGHAGPGAETPGGQMLGKWEYDYSIIPHAGDWRQACQLAYAFQTGLRAIETGIHPGEIPAQGSFVSSSSEAFIISAVKAAENGVGWLVRGVNISSDTIQLDLKPLRRFPHAALVDLAEQEISPIPVAEDGSVAISAARQKIVSVMFSD